MYCIKKYSGYNVSDFVPQNMNFMGNGVEVNYVSLIKL